MDTLSSALNTASVNYGNEEWGVTDELAAPGKREGEGEGGGGGTYFPPTVVEMMHTDLDAMSAHAQQLFREAAGAQVEGQRGAATDKLEHPANRTGRTGPAESVRTEAAASGRDAFAQALASPLSTPHTLPHMSSLGADAADARAAPPAVSSPSSQPSSTSRGYRFGDVTRSVVRRTRDWHQTRQQRREMSRSQPPATSKAEKEEEKLLPGIPKLMGRQLSDGGRQILRDQLSRCVGGPTFTTLHHFHLPSARPPPLGLTTPPSRHTNVGTFHLAAFPALPSSSKIATIISMQMHRPRSNHPLNPAEQPPSRRPGRQGSRRPTLRTRSKSPHCPSSARKGAKASSSSSSPNSPNGTLQSDHRASGLYSTAQTGMVG